MAQAIVQQHRRRDPAPSRFKNDIRDSRCPDCHAPPGNDCDHARDPYGPAKKAELARERTCHYSRMLVSYGRTPARALEIAELAWHGRKRTSPSLRPDRRSTAAIAVMLVRCPRHEAAEGEYCPRGGACQGRMTSASAAARRGRVTGPDLLPDQPSASAPEDAPASAIAKPECSCTICTEGFPQPAPAFETRYYVVWGSRSFTLYPKKEIDELLDGSPRFGDTRLHGGMRVREAA